MPTATGPDGRRNLLDVLLDAADRNPDQVIVHVREDGTERTVGFRELRDESLRVAGGLRAAGTAPGTPALILADAGDDFQPLFWGALAAGLVPVPMPPEPHRVRAVRDLLTDAVVLTDDATTAAEGVPGPVLRLSALRTGTPLDDLPDPAPDEVAFLQFSSGSTGTPRGVELTHANVLANLEQARLASGCGPDDVIVTWMPFFHDMGLIGTHLTPLAVGFKQVRVPPLAFAKRPALWFTTADRHRATMLSAANFALALAVRRVPSATLAGLDLSTVRCAVVGAEPISPAVWRSFVAHTRPAGLDPAALRPVYGLAEATLAVTFPPPGEVAVPLVLDRDALSRGRAEPTDPGPHAVELMDVGHPVPGCTVRIVDDNGRPVGEHRVGQIEVRGPNVARGYHLAPQATRDTFSDGWLRTGDLGFLRDGRLCVTGRAKDVVFVNGRTFHASDLERVAAATPGLPGEVTVVVGCTDPDTGGERIVVFVPWARPPAGAVAALDAVRARVAEASGHDEVMVLPLPPGAFARTTSGKLRRRRMRDRYLAGDFADRERLWCPPRTVPPVEADDTRPSVGDPTRMPRRELEDVIRGVWARVLGRPAAAIGPDDRFLAIGGSSLKAMEVLAGLEDALGAAVDPADLRDCPTVPALADRLAAGTATHPTRSVPVVAGDPRDTTVAVIGMACRFPGADTPEEFWRHLVDGVDDVGPVPRHRWTPQGDVSRWGSFLDDPMLFDAGFFGLTDTEARLTDPHARLFLEVGYEALERAGYAGPRRHGRRVGVFAAVGESAYPELLAGQGPVTGAGALTGNLRNLVPARLAQALDLTGPAVAVDTACSSALVALHLAARSLADGECDVAVVGGINLNLTETGYRLLDAAEALSPTGRCRAFDAAADGFVPGEGGAALVLRRTADARAAGDPVLALVAGTAVGNDGRSLSLLAPNPNRQWEVIARAYRDAGADPASVSYVEAHGTGTGIGDPVEVRSLAAAFPPPADGVPRRLGSVKTNLGHLLNAAGMPALVKVVLALRHRHLPPSLHHTRPSSRFDLDAAGFTVVTEAHPWTAPGPLVAGVNGFGFGGTNAHAVLREAPAAPPVPDAGGAGCHLATVSAHSASALRRAARDLAGHLRAHPDLTEADVCASAGTARDDGPYRLSVVAAGDLADRLDDAASTVVGTAVGRRPRIVLLFPDDGTAVPATLVRDLHDSQPVFRDLLVAADAAAGPVAGHPLLSWCLGTTPSGADPDRRVAGAVAVAVGLALAGQLAAWGVRPDAVLGYGPGALAAAATGGDLTPAEAVRHAVARSGEAPDEAGFRSALHRHLTDGHDTLVPLWTVDRLGDLLDESVAPADPVRVVTVLAPAGSDTGSGGSDTGSNGHPGTRLLLAALGRLWVAGCPLDRVALHGPRRRVPVPTYPFQRRSYGPPGTAVPLHVVVWEDAPESTGDLPTRVRLRGPGVSGAVATGLADALTAHGVEVQVVPTGSGPVDDAEPPQVTVLLAGASVDPPDLAGFDAAVAAQVDAFRDLLDAPPGRVLVVTEDVQVTGATDRPRPIQAVLTGLTAALGDERPGLLTRTVDLAGGDDVAVRVRSLCRELSDLTVDGVEATTGPAAGIGVAWRAGRRVVRHLVPAPDDSDNDNDGDGAPAAGAGVHVIVGGGGGIGAELARTLAGRGAPTVVLVGRSNRAPEGLLAELAASGATASYHTCDVTVPDDVDRLLRALPRVDIVYQAAGVVRLGTLAGKSTRDVLAVLAPKVRGSHLLAEAMHRYGHQRAALVGFSSVSAVLPGLAGAMGDYAAANAFLDAFAAAHRAAGRPFQAVGFAAVGGTGMAARAGVGTAVGSTGPAPMDVHAAVRALDAARRVDAAHLVVADLHPGPPPPRTASKGGGTFRTGPAGVPQTPSPTPAPTPASTSTSTPTPASTSTPTSASASASTSADIVAGATGAVPDVGELADLLRRLLAEPLHRRPDQIADDVSFLALGLDSLAAVDLVKRLEDELGRDLPVTLFFEYTTVAGLAAHLAADPGTGRPTPASTGSPAVAEPVPVSAGAPFPLTTVQRAFHVNERLHPDVASYAFVRQTVTGPLDPELLGRALARLAVDHPMLRVRFVPDPSTGTPCQVVTPPPADPAAPPDWFRVHPRTGPPVAIEEQLCNTPIDPTREPPLRAVLVPDGPNRSHLLLVLHHAAGDGFSLNLLGEDLWAGYTALTRGRHRPSPPSTPDFGEYAHRVPPPTEEDLAYWRDILTGPGWTLRLPYDGDPGALPAPPYASHLDELDADLVARLRDRAADAGVSLFHLLLAGYVRCLARWSGQRTVPVNVARAGRDARLPGIERIVGPFADTLPLLVDVDPAEPAGHLADRIRESWSAAQRRGTVSSLDLARLLGHGGGNGPRTPSPAGFSFARFPVTTDPDCPVTVVPTAAGSASAATRLSLLCWESGSTLGLSWNFPVRLFRRETVARLAADHHRVLVDLATDGPVANLPQPRPVEHAGTSGESDGGDVTARIRTVCRRTPDAVAVDHDGATLTYRDLDAAADRVAAHLTTTHGVRPRDPVGLLTAPGPATVVGVVGILRAGAAWVPLDAGHPPARLDDHLLRAGARVVLHDDESAPVAARLDTATRPVRFDGETGPAGFDGDDDSAPVGVVVSPPAPEETAYVIFTSGSTGRPKGVPVTHASLRNYLDWAVTTFGYRPGDRLAQTSSICFDASVRQLLAPLLVGATVVTVGWSLRRDPEALLTRLERGRVTVWSSVPTLWERILRAAEERTARDGTPPDLGGLRWVHVGGEELSPVPVRRWFDLFGDDCRITNLYGPTEATINATWHLIDSRPDDTVRRLPIGSPVGGAQVRVVDPDGAICPPGVAGELYLGGVGLTPGYLEEPELTRAAFVHLDGERFYRSGDRGRVTTDGVLEFLGRLDDQVKIHGYRLEPGEIEATLRTHPEVAGAVVLHQAEPHPRLHAFVVPAPQTTPTVAGLRAYLGDRLPEQLVPARLHLVDDLPTTPTGKVDRDRLRAYAGFGPTTAPTGETATGRTDGTGTETAVARIWADLLGLPGIGRDEDFFALGGDSILVLEVSARVRELFPHAPGPAVLYRHRTLRTLAAAVDAATVEARAAEARAAETDAVAVDAVETDAVAVDAPQTRRSDPGPGSGGGGDAGNPGPPYPVTPTQRGFLLADAIDPGAGTAWLARLRLRGRLRRDVFQRAVDLLVARHPMLRTVFPAGVRPPVQQELPASLRLPVGYEVLPHPDALATRVARERDRAFEPWAWPLLRLRLLAVSPDEHVLLVHAHHLIGDGYSAALLGRELLTAYHRLSLGRDDEPPPLRTHFREYVAHLARRAADPPDPAAHTWWSQRFGTPYRAPVLRAGEHRHDTATDGSGGRSEPAPGSGGTPGRQQTAPTVGFTLDTGVVTGLRRLAAEAGTTLHAPVLTAYHRALTHLTGQDDLVVGLALTGRDHALPDLHRVFGPCATMLPLRLHGTGGFVEHLAGVTAEVTAARRYDDPPSIAAAVPAAATGVPLGTQFFFSFLDFDALGVAAPPADGGPDDPRLDLDGDDGTELAPPPLGTDLFLTARPGPDGLRVVLRGSPGAVTPAELGRIADRLRADLTTAADPADGRRTAGDRQTAGDHRTAGVTAGGHRPGTRLAAAIVGYLPPPAQLAAIAGLPADGLPREHLRTLLFPDGRPRLLEELDTPLGGSGFVCLPRFADELTAAGELLAAEAAEAVDLAAGLGADCVSLAGMIPARTGYGIGVLRRTRSGVAVTTGHAATVVSVALAVEAAVAATGRLLAGRTVAVVGLGSIGFSALRLLLARTQGPPARLVLCDVPGAAPRLAAHAARLRADGFAATIEVCPSTPGIADAGYQADLIVAATSAATEPIDVDRLRPGTVVVDDSFPAALDTARALARMRQRRDVLVVGGGLLHVGDTHSHVPTDLPPAAVAGHASALAVPGTVASCRLESLLWAATPGLPLVHGLVAEEAATAYATALAGAGVTAAPLHLVHHVIEPDLPGALPG
ncbi:amino acid adenylation domain-containing protein [Micromonospora sp. NPDC000207]|uniref:non-ribosomal peptide synthetase/type I polyketide synthase n=1 Tax=Micromonospora sp. NPDC000207 TaxID=3154246 RepID=UPI00332445B7